MSGLLVSNCSGIKVIVNPRLSDYGNPTEVTTSTYMAFGSNDVNIPNTALYNFKLRCIHLVLGKGVEKVLILFMDEKLERRDKESGNKDTGNGQEDSEQRAAFVAVAPKYRLEKVVMAAETKRQIERAIALIRNQKRIFDDWGFSEVDPHTKTILCFYGPPGTGKTMCAHALASELGKNILIASYATIESKWVGEGPKNLQKIFKDAAEQDAILFFDEADSFLSKRVGNAETGSDKHYNRMSNEMFQLLEDYNGIIIFATNLVTDFDKAFKSRILSFVEFEKPDVQARKKLIRIMTPSRLPMATALTDDELNELATIADGFSGREIRKAMLTTLSEGAMNGISAFTVGEFVKGFTDVKQETAAIEMSMQGGDGSMAGCIEDFIKNNRENGYILDVCLKLVWQSDTVLDATKAQLFKTCKLLNLEMPDMTISYRNTDISGAGEAINAAGRVAECARYCADLAATCLDEDAMALDAVLAELGVANIEMYHRYLLAVTDIGIVT